MTRRPLRLASALFCGVVAISIAASSVAATFELKANLKGSTEVPANGTGGTGSLNAAYDTAAKRLSWRGTYSGLTGPATAAHFHIGNPGKNGPVVIPVILGSDAKGHFEGSAVLTDAQASDLLASKWYFNIHTAAHKEGEIRGQVTKK